MIIFFYFVTLLAIINAGYLFFQHQRQIKTGRPISCPLNGHCENVLNTPYNKTLGIANELWGIGYTVLLIVLAFFAQTTFSFNAVARIFLLLLTMVGVIMSTYLLFIMKYVLKSFCFWCVLAHAFNFLLAITILVIFN